MRTFQFSDAKSHKFWNIDVSGSSFTVTYGKVGTVGQTQTKAFPSAEKAQAEAEKLIREKTGKGYRETTPKAEVSQAEAFEAGLLDHPQDIARWSAYADYLAEQGDPRGEFMAVQLALEDESLSAADRKKLKKAEADMLKTHEREWLGPLAAFTVDGEKVKRWRSGGQGELPPVMHHFERGWLRSVEFFDLTVNQARALVACPDARMLRELVVDQLAYDDTFEPGADVPEDAEEGQTGLHALCRCPHLAAVRAFRLGEPAELDDEYGGRCHTPGDLAHHVVKQMPRLERLELHAHRVDAGKVFALPMPNLRHLSLLHSDSYPLDKLAANPTLIHLDTIQCHPHAMEHGDEEAGAYIRLEHLRAICRSPHLKGLKHLCLRLSDFGDAGAKELVESGLLSRLRVLDLRGGCVSDAGAKLLAASPHLKKLEFLNLQRNALTAEGVRQIEVSGVKADLTNQHTDISFDSSGETPRYLYEGDYE
jgi:uncharacterized protein (TIGR02996 family)